MLFFGSIGNSMGLISTALSANGIIALSLFGLILYAGVDMNIHTYIHIYIYLYINVCMLALIFYFLF